MEAFLVDVATGERHCVDIGVDDKAGDVKVLAHQALYPSGLLHDRQLSVAGCLVPDDEPLCGIPGVQEGCTIEVSYQHLLDALHSGEKQVWEVPLCLTDPGQVLEAVRARPSVFVDAHPSVKRDRDIVLAAVHECPCNFEGADDSLKADREVVLAALAVRHYCSDYVCGCREREGCRPFVHVHDTLKADRDFMLEAVGRDGSFFEYADESMKIDREFVLSLLRVDASCFRHVHKSLWSDRDFLLAAAEAGDPELAHGTIWRNTNDAMRDDPGFILTAIQEHRPSYFDEAGDNVRCNRDIILAAAQAGYRDTLSSAYRPADRELVLALLQVDGCFLDQVHGALLSDRDIILAAMLAGRFDALEYAHESVKADRDLVLMLLQVDVCFLDQADTSLMSDRDVILAAARAGRRDALQYAHESLKADREFVLALLRIDACFLDQADTSLMSDRDIILAAVHAGHRDALQYAHDSLKADREFVLALLRVDPCCLGDADGSPKTAGQEEADGPRYSLGFYSTHASLREDKDFLREAVAFDSRLLKHTEVLKAVACDPSLLDTKHNHVEARKSLFFKAIQKHPHVLKYAPELWKQDRQIVHVAVKANGGSLKHAHQTLKADPDIVFAAVRSDPSALKYADGTLATDKSLVTSILQKIPGAFPHVHESLQTDRDFVLAAVQKCPRLLRHVHKSLTADREFMHAVMQTPRASKYVGRSLKPTGNPFLLLRC